MGTRTAIVLAAGSSRRFGDNKLLVEIDGTPLVRVAVDGVLRSSVSDVIVVVGHDARRVEEALRDERVRVVENSRHDEGMGGSIAVGARALGADCTHAAILLGDQPIEPALIDTLFDFADRMRRPIAAPVYRGARRHPVIFAASMFADLRGLSGHGGARVLLDADPSRVALLELDQPVPADLDVPGDLPELEDSLRERRAAQEAEERGW